LYRILNANCEIILNRLLNSSKPVSSSDIKDSLNISRKTVTEVIQKLDRYLINHGASIRTVNGIGYSIVKSDEDKFKTFSETFLRHFHRDHFMYLDQNYLVYLIALKFLVSEGYINVETLTEEYCHSSSTISQNLQKVKAYFKKFGLHLQSRPNYGLILQGGEWNRRICMLFSAKIANAINFMQHDSIPVIRTFREMLEKSLDNYFLIKAELEPVLHKHGIHIPLSYQMLISYYIYLSQSRLEWYDQLEFKYEHVERVKGTNDFNVSKEIAALFGGKGFVVGENDVIALSILLDSYATRYEISELKKEQYALCSDDTRHLLKRVAELYPGAELGLDEVFFNEFTCYLAGIRERIFFEMPSDEGIIFLAKHQGTFVSDLCLDFARLFEELHGIRLKTAELMTAYYIFASAYTRRANIKAQYRAILVSLYGIHFARDVAARLMRIYDRVLIEIVPMELTEANYADVEKYDLIITDIAKNQFISMELPVLFFDIYREDYLRSLDRFISDSVADRLRRIILEKNIVRDGNFVCKEDVFKYLAEKYVSKDERNAFFEDCRRNNEFLSFERKNNIAMVSTFPAYYDKQEIVILLNKTSFFWDDEQVHMVVFFNRRGMKYHDIRIMNILQKRLLSDVAGTARNVGRMSAEELIASIAYQKKTP